MILFYIIWAAFGNNFIQVSITGFKNKNSLAVQKSLPSTEENILTIFKTYLNPFRENEESGEDQK